MTTFSFYSFSIFKISPYINLKKFLGRILAPPSGRRPGADAPPCPPLATPLEDIKQSTQDQIAFLAKQISGQIQEIKNQQPYMQRYAMPQATHAIQQSIPTYQIQQQ